ncbi:hypothetical protein KUTeg_004510 [Tegillarca granosa]|uniref:Reverse transcriptase zinc-binding domain-containing protein n=1 Tax=Tegillarca granosa TaxID=220873 RepID=A0ABQ9FQ80_TEGGR|nr:hypothetical protein KUTeg_004510 [Tegillarca granosa]
MFCIHISGQKPSDYKENVSSQNHTYKVSTVLISSRTDSQGLCHHNSVIFMRNQVLPSSSHNVHYMLIITTGLGYIWNSQDVVPNDWLKSIVKQSLCDQFVQSWSSSLQNSPKGQFYHMFKMDFKCEDYFLKLNTSSVFWICKLRTSNMNFPVETGRWSGLNRNERKCPLCTSGIGDEMHYLFQCDFFSTYRIKYIPMYYIKYPNIEKLQGLLTYCNKRVLENISVFLKIIYKTLNNHR